MKHLKYLFISIGFVQFQFNEIKKVCKKRILLEHYINIKYFHKKEKLLVIIVINSRFIPKGVAQASQIILQNLYFAKIKPVAVWSMSILDLSPVNPLVALYDVHRRKRRMLF
jgi:hypothetical protein